MHNGSEDVKVVQGFTQARYSRRAQRCKALILISIQQIVEQTFVYIDFFF